MSASLFPEWTPASPWIPVLAGPTAVGKTAWALDWAERHGAHIVSADSRQVYRRLDIGTAKPTGDELARVPHHFISEKDLSEPFSAGQFAEEAEARIQNLRQAGRPVLVTGGSTLYLEALIHGLARVPQVDPALREELNHTVRSAKGAALLYEELARVDPTAARTMDATKTQRIVRALEVWRGTGRTLSSYLLECTVPRFQYKVVVLNRDRVVLYERIEKRVDVMLADGLLDECRNLLESGVSMETNPLKTIGYREPFAYLEGTLAYEPMVELLKRNSRRYAKRQLTWFRRRSEYAWHHLQ